MHDNDYLRELMNELTGGDAMVSANVCMAVAEAYAEGFLDWLAVEDDNQIPGVAGLYLGVVEHSGGSHLPCRYVCVLFVTERDSEYFWADLTVGHRVTHYKPYRIEMPK